MYEYIKKEVLKTAMKLNEYGLIKMSAGNISVRCTDNSEEIIVTPSGINYEEIGEKDLIVINMNKQVLEGTRRLSYDIDALIYIYKKMPGVNAIIHTHQVYATAVGLISDTLPLLTTTLANAVGGEVKVAPFSSAASIEMGIKAVDYLDNRKAVILKNHGVITIGKRLKEALYAAVYLEETAKIYCLTKPIGKPCILNKDQSEQAVKIFEDYIH